MSMVKRSNNTQKPNFIKLFYFYVDYVTFIFEQNLNI